MDRILPSQLIPKLYLILVFISIMMFFISIEQIKPVVVTIDDFLGLTSCLTPLYWIGLSIAICCAIFAFFDKKLSKDYVFILVLITLGIFMFGPRIFAEANGWNSGAYWFGAMYNDVSNNYPINLSSSNALINYSAWPATHLISAFLLNITGVEYEALIKYMPLFWLIAVIFISFTIGKRLGLSPSQSFLLTIIVTSAFWVNQYAYSAQMLAYILYLFIFVFIVSAKDKPANIIVLFIAFMGLMLTHGLTSVAVIIASITISIFQRKPRIIMTLLIIFISWLVYMTPLALEVGLEKMWVQLINMDFLAFTSNPGYSTSVSLSGEIGKYIRLFYPAVLALFVISAALLYLIGKNNRENKKKIAICIAWGIGIVLLSLVPTAWAQEIDWRLYAFLLIPAASIISLSFSNKVIISFLMVLFIILHIPAAYHSESLEQTFTSELAGAKFFANSIKPIGPVYILYERGSQRYIQYYDSNKLHDINWIPALKEGLSIEIVQETVASVLEKCEYIITNNKNSNVFLFSYGFDPVEKWLQENEINLTYNNGQYQININ